MSRSPLDHPEIKKLFHKLAPVLIAESDGGAVLIGTAHVEERPRELFESSIFNPIDEPINECADFTWSCNVRQRSMRLHDTANH